MTLIVARVVGTFENPERIGAVGRGLLIEKVLPPPDVSDGPSPNWQRLLSFLTIGENKKQKNIFKVHFSQKIFIFHVLSNTLLQLSFAFEMINFTLVLFFCEKPLFIYIKSFHVGQCWFLSVILKSNVIKCNNSIYIHSL